MDDNINRATKGVTNAIVVSKVTLQTIRWDTTDRHELAYRAFFAHAKA
jgi:hypothetical protein